LQIQFEFIGERWLIPPGNFVDFHRVQRCVQGSGVIGCEDIILLVEDFADRISTPCSGK